LKKDENKKKKRSKKVKKIGKSGSTSGKKKTNKDKSQFLPSSSKMKSWIASTDLKKN